MFELKTQRLILRDILDLAFDTFSAKVIIGECDAANLGSARVMEKAGMRLVLADDEIRVYVVTQSEN